MHITLDEAKSLLDSWKATGTVLKVYLPRAGRSQELQATVANISGAIVGIDASGDKIELDLTGAEFNGDRRSAPNSNQGAYLVCEYRNGDRYSFYAPRPAGPETEKPSTDRRSAS